MTFDLYSIDDDVITNYDYTRGDDGTNDGPCFSIWEVYALIVPILIGLTFLPSFKILAFSAYIGSVFLVLAVTVSSRVEHLY